MLGGCCKSKWSGINEEYSLRLQGKSCGTYTSIENDGIGCKGRQNPVMFGMKALCCKIVQIMDRCDTGRNKCFSVELWD